MAQDKYLSRLEAKVDALLKHAGIDPDSITFASPTSEVAEPSEAEKTAMANAPATPAATPPPSEPATPEAAPATPAPLESDMDEAPAVPRRK